jgi:hypothetical protein
MLIDEGFNKLGDFFLLTAREAGRDWNAKIELATPLGTPPLRTPPTDPEQYQKVRSLSRGLARERELIERKAASFFFVRHILGVAGSCGIFLVDENSS